MSSSSISYRNKRVLDILSFFLVLASCIMGIIYSLLIFPLNLINGFFITAIVIGGAYCLYLDIPAIYSCCCPNEEEEEEEEEEEGLTIVFIL